MLRIAAIGDNCIDIYTNLGKSFPGGGAVNFAVQARRAGAETAYIGVIGDDLHGDWLAGALAAAQVEAAHLIRVPGPTAIALVKMDHNERTFIGSDHGVRGQLQVTPEIDAYLDTFDLIHTTLDGGVDAHIPRWHRSGRRLSYDFSHRPSLAQLDLLPCLDVAFFSGQHLDPTAAPEQLIALQQRGVPVAVLTLGAHGSLACDGTRIYYQPALPVAVVDTLGAGDAFQAGFMVEYLTSGAIPAALLAGASRAAAACGHYGGFGSGHDSLVREHTQ